MPMIVFWLEQVCTQLEHWYNEQVKQIYYNVKKHEKNTYLSGHFFSQ